MSKLYRDKKGKFLSIKKIWNGKIKNLSYVNLQGADLQRADLREANLVEADLREADLQGADIDFSVWPLWCGSLSAILDLNQKRQLLYHTLSVAPEFRTRKLVTEANKFHRVIDGSVPALKVEVKK